MLGRVRRLLMAIAWLLLEIRRVTWAVLTVNIALLLGVYMISKAIAYETFYSHSKDKGIVCHDENELITCDSDVLVHGVFGFGEGKMGGIPYFGGIENMYRKIFNPDLGSLTSLYDRARQLFYYLKGGRVDYGEEHSKAYGHSQSGRVYKQDDTVDAWDVNEVTDRANPYNYDGKYSQWDEDNPIHFVGHTAGGQVIRILQQMLADKAFDGYDNTSAKWIASVTTISGAMNGGTITYIYGMQPDDWRFAKTMSPLGLFRFAIIFYEWLDIPLLKRYYNFGFDHFHMSRNNKGFWGLVDCLSGNAGPFVSSDWVMPDVTIQGSSQINSRLNTFPNTYYFSYATRATKQVGGKVVPKRLQASDTLSSIHSLWICKWCYPTNVQHPYDEYTDEDWWDNDGQLNTISMTHPCLPNEHPHCLVPNSFKLEPQPGVWYNEMVEAYHGQFILSIKTGSHIHQMYDSIFKRCRNLDTKRSSQCVT